MRTHVNAVLSLFFVTCLFVGCDESYVITSHTCVDGNCKDNDLDQSSNGDSGDDTGQAHSVTNCGASKINCTTIAGWKSGVCKNARCEVEQCQPGYCLDSLSGQCTSAQNNSTCGIDGGVCQSCNQEQVCTNGGCTKLCKGNVCNQTKDSGKTLVCKNDNTHCGANCQDCNTFTKNAVSGRCNIASGTCTVTQCDNGFHIYNNSCEKDDTNNCGVHSKVCSNIVAGWKHGECQNKQCKVTECQSGRHLTSQGVCEPDTDTETDTCCGITCQICGADSTCIDGLCQKECLAMNDPEIGKYATEHWDINHDGCISRSEAEAVTEIPEKAFYDNTSLNSLSDLEQFPNLKTIGNFAFSGCTGLTSVSLPQATYIGDSAFSGCTSIASIALPEATYIGDRAFEGRGVIEHDYYSEGAHQSGHPDYCHHCYESYYMSYEGITRETIENTSLSFVSLPKATYIGNEAFSGCTGLTSITLPQATYVGERAFIGGVIEHDYQTFDHITIDYDDMGDYGDYDDMGGEYIGSSTQVFPNGNGITRRIKENTGLTSIDLPKATYIGDEAFVGCTGLTSIDLPQATYIGNRAFVGDVEKVNNEYESVKVNYEENSSLRSVSLPQATSIGDSAFSVCTSLMSVDLPMVTEIGDSAFSGCTSLTSVDLPMVTEIGDSAFSGCTSLTFIDIPKVTSIGQEVFLGCTSLTSVDLPMVTEIGDSAFSGCTGLTFIDIPNVVSIGDSAFSGCTSLTSIDLPKVTSVGKEVFSDCTGLTSIDLPQVTSIGDRAFSGCTGLTSIDLPQVTSIGDRAFSGCTGLTSIDLPQVTSIGNSAFSGCTGLTSIDLPMATSIGDWAFSGCTGLTSIDLPMVTEFGFRAFVGCTGLTSIDIPNVASIGNSAFSGCTGLMSIDLPQVTSIGDRAFSGCTGLTSIDLPQVTSIGNWAFSRCTGLTSIDLPQVTSIGDSAFSGCTSLTSIDLPLVTSIGDWVFSNCTSLSSLALTSPDIIILTNESLDPWSYGSYVSETLSLDNVMLTLHKNKAVGGSSSPLCTSDTEWMGKTWKDIRFVQ